jgi:hypothetical protein
MSFILSSRFLMWWGKKQKEKLLIFMIKTKTSIFILDSRGKVYSHSEGEYFELF